MTVKIPAALIVSLSLAAVAEAGTASGAFTLQKGTSISPKHAVAYVVRDQRDARKKQVEILLTTMPLEPTALQTALDPHMAAINHDALMKSNYVLLWIGSDGSVTMNATYGASMKQFINDTTDGLKATLTTNTATKVEGRVTTAAPVGEGDSAYSVDLSFSVDVPVSAGQPLPAGGGEAGKAFTALLAAAQKKNWAGVTAVTTPSMQKMLGADYNTPAENGAYALDMIKVWVPMAKTKVGAGELRGDTAILDVEGEMFPGMRGLTLVKLVKSSGAWKVDQIQRAGLLP